jgi:hypothetical protein
MKEIATMDESAPDFAVPDQYTPAWLEMAGIAISGPCAEAGKASPGGERAAVKYFDQGLSN